MENVAFLKLLIVLFLALSFVLSSTAVPATRMLKSNTGNPSQIHDFLAQEAMKINDSGEFLGMEQGYIEGRIDIEITDYARTGANNHHDPKTPGSG